MADTLTISLTGALADNIRAAAEARGLSPEDYVRQELAGSIMHEDRYNDLSWDEDMRRLEEPGEDIPLDEAFDRFEARVAALRAQKTKK
jgi:hypothetical protein